MNELLACLCDVCVTLLQVAEEHAPPTPLPLGARQGAGGVAAGRKLRRGKPWLALVLLGLREEVEGWGVKWGLEVRWESKDFPLPRLMLPIVERERLRQ